MPDFIDNEHLRNLLRTTPGDAIQILYKHYAGSLRAIARKLTRDEGAAEDIVQEAFVYVWRHADQLGKVHEKSIQHYLVKVVRNRAISHYKESMKDAVRKNVFVTERLGEAKASLQRLIRRQPAFSVRTFLKATPFDDLLAGRFADAFTVAGAPAG